MTYGKPFWICDGIWVVNIMADFITIRHSIVWKDNLDIIFDYLKTEFLIDLIATIPTMISDHSDKLMFLRLLHIFNLRKADSMVKNVLELCLPFQRKLRGQILVFIRITFIIVLLVHFQVVLWLFIGT
jgi:hypothetical protein